MGCGTAAASVEIIIKGICQVVAAGPRDSCIKNYVRRTSLKRILSRSIKQESPVSLIRSYDGHLLPGDMERLATESADISSG